MNNLLTLEKRIELLEKFIYSESKQVGVLYHVVDPEIMSKYIIKSDSLEGSAVSGNPGNYHYPDAETTVFFTRDKRFNILNVTNPTESVFGIQLVIDGDSLSERYKLVPYNQDQMFANNGDAFYKRHPEYLDAQNRQSEVIAIRAIKNVSKYITEIRLLTTSGTANPFVKSLAKMKPGDFSDRAIKNLSDDYDEIQNIYDYLSNIKEYADSHNISTDSLFNKVYDNLTELIELSTFNNEDNDEAALNKIHKLVTGKSATKIYTEYKSLEMYIQQAPYEVYLEYNVGNFKLHINITKKGKTPWDKDTVYNKTFEHGLDDPDMIANEIISVIQ